MDKNLDLYWEGVRFESRSFYRLRNLRGF